MTPLPADDHRDQPDRTGLAPDYGFTPDSDFGKALTQAMDNFASDAQAPVFDGSAILQRTRRRRATLTVAASAAAIALTAGTAFALQSPSRPPSRTVAAAPSAGADSSPSPTGTSLPTSAPTSAPTGTPTASFPTPFPTSAPTPSGTPGTSFPTSMPTGAPGTSSPTSFPTSFPTSAPTGAPSPSPSTGFGTPSPGPDNTGAPGQTAVTVPNVIGQSKDAAGRTLTASGLQVGHVQNFTDWHVPAGSVISMTPAAGSKVAPGTAVDIFVSTGKP